MFTTWAVCILFVLPLIDIGNGAFDDHLAMDFNINQNYSANFSEVSQKERHKSERLNESVDETKTEGTGIMWAEQTGDKSAEEIYVDPNPTVQPKYNSLPNTKPNRNRFVTPNLQNQQQHPTAFPQPNTAQINDLQVTPYASLIQAQEGPDLLHKRSRNIKISDKIVGGVTNIHSEETVTRPNFIQSNEIEPPILMDDSSASSSEMGGVSKNVYLEMKDEVLLDRDRRSYADFSKNQYGSGVLQVRAEFRLTPVYKNTTKSITDFLTNHIIPFIKNMSNQPFTDVESFSSNLINVIESYTEVEVDIQLRSKEDGYLSEDDRLVRLALATAFKNLTTLLNYSVSHKSIANITDVMVSYSCISCKSNEVCIQNSPTDDVWNCMYEK
ncbi:uncharacterized protein LOC131935654 [Physella acuta]|uniref:uncharacterized protein LOC131935654 n=1 Tax=Physella acuta TaxID=109671 RepID=UPI0027DBE566|nr:uncharacterized protein LOC131935654 [Physella acuta]